MMLHISPAPLLRPAANSFLVCKMQISPFADHRLPASDCTELKVVASSSSLITLCPQIHAGSALFKGLQVVLRSSRSAGDFDSRAVQVTFAASRLTARQSLPPPEPNEAEPTPKCHRHAIGVTIYVKLKRTSKIKSTWWNVLRARRQASTINLFAEFSSRNLPGWTPACRKLVGQEVT